MVNEAKRQFLEKEFIPLIKEIGPPTKPRWGKMNTQQMIEHVSGFFRISSGKLKFPLSIRVEHLPKYREFLMSEKEFREIQKRPSCRKSPCLCDIQQLMKQLLIWRTR
jgi:hypothetical protein